MFSTLGNTIRLLRIMLDVRKREKSKIAAEISVISYLLSVIGSNLWFIPYPYIWNSSEYFSRLARPGKHGYSRWNFVAITYTTEDTSVLAIMNFWFMAAIFDMDFCHLLFLLSAATLLSWKTHYRSLYRLPLVFYISWYDDMFFSFIWIYIKLFLPTSIVEVATG